MKHIWNIESEIQLTELSFSLEVALLTALARQLADRDQISAAFQLATHQFTERRQPTGLSADLHKAFGYLSFVSVQQNVIISIKYFCFVAYNKNSYLYIYAIAVLSTWLLWKLMQGTQLI